MKIAVRVLAGFLTFSLGLACFCGVREILDAPFEPIAEPVAPEALNVSPCELGVDKGDNYEGKIVELEATTFVNGFDELVLYPNYNCLEHADDFPWWPDLDLTNFNGENSNLTALLHERPLEVDIRVNGVARRTLVGGVRTYAIQPTKITLISPFRKFVAKGAS